MQESNLLKIFAIYVFGGGGVSWDFMYFGI